MLPRFLQDDQGGRRDDLRVLRQTTLPLVALPVALTGWTWLAYTLVAMGGDIIITPAIAPAALLVGGILALERNAHSTTVATLLLLVGLAVAFFSESWLNFGSLGPYAFVLVVAITGLLLRPVSGLASALPCALLIAVAGRYGLSGPQAWAEIMQPVLLVTFTASVSFLAARNLFHALDWAWENAMLASQRLEEARDRQEALNRTLRSLDDTYELLQRARREEAIARQQAEEGQRLKAQFASTVSHELRTPLNAIIGFSELMHTAPEVYGDVAWPVALRSDINEIYRNARHLQRLIDDILDLAQIDAMRMELMEEETNLADLIHEAVSAASGLVRGKDVHLHIELSPRLPHLYVDATRIRQVLLNLLSNACRFTEHGRITVSAALEGDSIHTTVTDTGIGMTAQQLARAFREFQQADGSLRRRYGGTGLGLAISRRFVELHGGRIWAESEPGVGTSVHFTLPVARAHTAGSTSEAEQVIERHSEESEVRTVVLQGGLESGLRLLARYVRGYHFLPSADAAQTLHLVASRHPWAVVVASETGSDAYDVAAKIYQADPALAVPVLSYAIDSADATRLPQNVEWFTKPVKRTDLLATLRRLAPHGRRILVVDDNPTDVQLLARMLRSAEREYIVEEALNGSEALSLLSAHAPDAVLLDLIMPDISGLEVAQRIWSNPDLTGLPVLMVSAGDVSARQGPLYTPNVHRLTLVKNGGLKTQEWLASIKALLDAVAPRYVADEDTPELRPASQSD